MVTTPKLVFVGAATLDAIALVDTFPEPDSRQVARDVTYAGGGPAATAAVAAARLGIPSAIVGSVGDDGEGERILAALRQEDVDVSAVEVVAGQRSGASVIVADAGRGTRAIHTRVVPPLRILADGRADQLVAAAEWVHADHLGWSAIHDQLTRFSARRRPRLSVDGGNPILGFTAAGVDLYVPTVDALVLRYGDAPVPQLLTSALAEGAGTVVATDGAAGSVVADSQGARHTVPGHDVEVVSTLGAGDVFHGALLAGLAHGMTPPEATGYANVAAALSCRGVDGRSAIPTDADVRAVLGSAVTSAGRPVDVLTAAPTEETR
ncbi:sulfofructose kinase [Haloactinopolyspora alba]|uniref:Sulfofructose kinase n=1 Tax=Haloactinopolyspora alba TaxID=648780 RepID=A0A2P8EG14_9ACTN|nr:PfkB family carbohydrate kinase [Haloactinopolyspora alba]PSL08392.1 sulfofructose kinase [Haloactinopolyspora alba]